MVQGPRRGVSRSGVKDGKSYELAKSKTGGDHMEIHVCNGYRSAGIKQHGQQRD